MSTGHRRLPPSAALRWGTCGGSVALIESLPHQDGGSSYSREGTAAHEVAAACLNENKDAWEFAGTERILVEGGIEYKIPVTDEMVEGVQLYIDYIRSRPGAILRFVEAKVDAYDLHKDVGGTLDAGLLYNTEGVPGQTLEIVDLKFGFGLVEVDGNWQLGTYGGSLLRKLIAEHPGIDRVKLTIVQPRAHHPDGPIRSQLVYARDLNNWMVDVLKPAADLTDQPGAPLVPGPHCDKTFCPAKGVCPALRKQFLADVAAIEKAAAPAETNDFELGDLLRRFPEVEARIGAYRDEAYLRLLKGATVPGYKLVDAKTNRIWLDTAEPAVLATFGDKAYIKKLLTPPAIEKLPGGKKFVAEWAHKPKGGLTMATADDKRPAVVPPPNAAEVFGIKPKETEDV